MLSLKHNQTGSIFLLALFSSSLFLVMFGATLSYIIVQHESVQYEIAKFQSINMAEAGVQYYRWHLAHDPTDFDSDTGTHEYYDQYGEKIGEYTLEVGTPASGTTIATITSSAHTTEYENMISRIRVRYGKPSLGHYAVITNSNIWFGDTENVSGEIHSNGGVRMDGIGDSILSSDEETYECGPEHGCDEEEKDGVWGSGYDPMFWEFPVDEIDFNDLTLDQDVMEEDAMEDGIYMPDSGSYGYFLEFNSDGTLTINTVTDVYSPVYGYNGDDWTYEANDKKSWTPVAGYQNIPVPNDEIIFIEDDLWVGGTLNGRVTVSAARVPDHYYPRADIFIQDDITYANDDGSCVLALISQEDILVTLRSEDVLEIDATLMAINGHVFRYYYPAWTSEPYNTYAVRDRIETYGTIITNTIWTWSWVSVAGGPVVSGYEETETIYDPHLSYAPPPSFPTEDEYAFISWEELEPNEE